MGGMSHYLCQQKDTQALSGNRNCLWGGHQRDRRGQHFPWINSNVSTLDHVRAFPIENHF